MPRSGSPGPGRAGLALAVVSLLAGVLVALAPPSPAAADTGAAGPCAPDSRFVWGWVGGFCLASAPTAGGVMELVFYPSTGGDLIGGVVCRPTDAARHPIVVVNHGGWGQPPVEDLTAACDEWTGAAGYVTLQPFYRPPGVAPFGDEVCTGEVDDSLTMLAIGRWLPSADARRVVMFGVSHGGCVTLRAVERGVPGLLAAATVSAITDAAGVHDHADAQLRNLLNLCPLRVRDLSSDCAGWTYLRQILEQATGGPPSPATQAAYQARSLVSDPAPLATTPVDLLVAHGEDDQFVPVGQACSLVDGVESAGGPSFATFHLAAAAGAPLSGAAPRACRGPHVWPTVGDPRPAGFPGSRYLMVYDGARHSDGRTYADMHADAVAFLRAKTPA